MSDEVGLTCLYKDGEAQIFQGPDVAQKMEDGWCDTPQPKGDNPAADPAMEPGMPDPVETPEVPESEVPEPEAVETPEAVEATLEGGVADAEGSFSGGMGDNVL